MNADSPWIAVDRIDAFKAFCEREGCKVRLHSSLKHNEMQVRSAGHWMAVLWNKNKRRFTVDRRLSTLVEKFNAAKPTEPTPPTQGDAK